ncbi:MAG: hypothetical protein ACJ71K_16055 [Nitrososphaeraceae archaeon]|jgi:hypothetical protein
MISSFVYNVIIATRLANNTIFASMEAFNTSMLQAKDNTKIITEDMIRNLAALPI